MGSHRNERAWMGAGHAGPARGKAGPRSTGGTPSFGPSGQHYKSRTFCTLLAEVCNQLGHTKEGLQMLAEAHTLVEQHEERYWKRKFIALRGTLLLRQPGMPQAEAESWLQRGSRRRPSPGGQIPELRAAMSLSRLWQQQGKRAEAYDPLLPIYGWFTEGFDTTTSRMRRRCWRS